MRMDVSVSRGTAAWCLCLRLPGVLAGNPFWGFEPVIAYQPARWG